MKSITINFIFTVMTSISVFAQYTPGNGVCELPTWYDWSEGGGANPCACKWIDPVSGWTVCSYGNCGQAELQECASSDCANYVSGVGYVSPAGWYQGGGNYGFNICAVALPIELSYFKAETYGRRVNLMWETVSESNNDYFEIFYSKDGIAFHSIAVIPGSGTTTEIQTYLFVHQMVEEGIHYYRLNQVDFDGEVSETSVISVDNRHSSTNSYFSDLTPNPSSSSTSFAYLSNDVNVPIEVKVVDGATGAIVAEHYFSDITQGKRFTVPTESLANGVYYLSIVQGDYIDTKSLVVMH